MRLHLGAELFFLLSLTDFSVADIEEHKYCIVGAGPAGVQLGHFLYLAERDYIILERAPQAASWFSKFPIHRVLNYINRRFTRRANLEFNLRHDWNSLLGSEKTVGLFGSWSKDYWPSADTLVKYINAFAEPQVQAGKLRFRQTVLNVAACNHPDADQAHSTGFVCNYLLSVMNSSRTNDKSCKSDDSTDEFRCRADNVEAWQIKCSVVIMANGQQKPRQVKDWIDGLSTVSIPYSELDRFPLESFENRSVLIVGGGNAAMETADALRDYVQDIQVLGRYEFPSRRMAETHYVGDLRGRRGTLHDAFYFKSYEGELTYDYGKRFIAVPCGPDTDHRGFQGKPPVCIFPVAEGEDEMENRGDFVVLTSVEELRMDLVNEAKRVFGNRVFERKPTLALAASRQIEQQLPVIPQRAINKVLCMTTSDLRRPMNLKERELLVRLKDTVTNVVEDSEEWRKPIDTVITALGWQYDTSIFDTSVTINMTGPPQRKHDQQTYPLLSSEYESVSAKHLFVAGAASHGMDRYKYKGSGGFIHGFRFTARALWRILEARYEHELHPVSQPITVDGTTKFTWDFADPKMMRFNASQVVGLANALPPLWAKLQERINDAAGPYEMVGGSLADGIIYDCKGKSAWYMEDVPEDLIHDRYSEHPRLTWSYHYGRFHRDMYQASICGVRAASAGVFSNFIHPVLQYFPAGPVRSSFGGSIGAVGPWGESGNNHSDTKSLLHRYLIKKGELDFREHPSTVWAEFAEVRRLHIREAYVQTNWDDPDVIERMSLFMAHIEVGAAQFCRGQGSGDVDHKFDEATDVVLQIKSHPLTKKARKKLNEGCDDLVAKLQWR